MWGVVGSNAKLRTQDILTPMIHGAWVPTLVNESYSRTEYNKNSV